MSNLTCPRCNGKGSTIMKDTGMRVNCPTCNGTGMLKNDFLDSESENENEMSENPVKQEIQKEVSEKDKKVILKQIIKYPDLFLNGINLLYKDENNELFIYLQNQQIFDIQNTPESMLVKLKPEYKNSLAKQCIEFLTKKGKK